MDYTKLVKELKKYIHKADNKVEKRIVDTHEFAVDKLFIGIIENEFISIKGYEVYIFVEYKNDIAVPLLYTQFKSKEKAHEYYKEIKTLILEKNIDKIVAEIEN